MHYVTRIKSSSLKMDTNIDVLVVSSCHQNTTETSWARRVGFLDWYLWSNASTLSFIPPHNAMNCGKLLYSTAEVNPIYYTCPCDTQSSRILVRWQINPSTTL